MHVQDDAAPLAIGDTCKVKMAGEWRFDGKVVSVHSDGTCNVHLQDENITLTNKPPDEVQKMALDRYAQLELEVAELQVRIDRDMSTAHLVRGNQSRACCTVWPLLGICFVSVAAFLFVTAFQLKPSFHENVDGSSTCRVCARYGCSTWPADNARCHEHFLPYVYAASCATVLALIVVFIQAIELHRCQATWLEGEPLGGYDCTWQFCGVIGWARTYWCCGDHATESELEEYDMTSWRIRMRQNRRLFDRATARLSRMGSSRGRLHGGANGQTDIL